MTRLGPVVLGFAVILAMLSYAAVGQTLIDPAIDVRLPQRGLDIDAGNSAPLSVTVTNAGNVDGTVALRLVIPDGWRATLDPPSPFTLAAGAVATVELVLTAPDATVGSANGLVEVVGQLTDAAGRSATTAAGLAVNRIDQAPFPTPIPWYETSRARIAFAGSLLLVGLVAGAAAAWQRRRERAAHWVAQETGITLTTANVSQAYGATRDVVHRLVVANISERPRVAHVRVAAVPAGWRASLSLARMPLSPGERQPVTLHATPNDTIVPGEMAAILVAARAEEAQVHEDIVTITVHAPAPQTRIAVVDVAARRPVLRR